MWAGDGSADRWRRSVGQGWRNGDAAGRLGFPDSSVSLLGGSDNIRESNAKGDRELGEWPSGQCECPDGPSSVVCGLTGLWATLLRLEFNKRLRITENNKLRP